MVPQKRSSGDDSGNSSEQDEVVRLPVRKIDLSGKLDAMPAPPRPERLQPTPGIALLEDDAEAAPEPTPADLGMPWEEAEATSGAHTPIGWLVLIGVILIAVGGWAVGRLSKGKERFEEEVERVEDQLKEDEREHESAQVLLARIEELARDYLQAGSIEEKLAYVRHRDRVRPLMVDYYERNEMEPVQYEELTEFTSIGLENRSFFTVGARLTGGAKVLLFAEQTPEGELKLDWESEVAYNPMEIEDYLAQKPTEPMEFRVYARLDNFYSYEFSNNVRYKAVMLTLRDSEEFLFGYVEMGTDAELALTQYLTPRIKQRKPALLRLRFLPETRARRSVLVEEFIAPRWVYIDDPAAAE